MSDPSYSQPDPSLGMNYGGSMRAIGAGIAFALLFSLMNGLSTHVFNGDTISERAVARFGGAN